MALVLKPHKDAEARRRSASHLIKLLLQGDPAILPTHRAEAMSVALWKFTEANGKYKTPYYSQEALNATKAEWIHEHVFQRAMMIKELLNDPQNVEKILERALGCIITKREHALLEKYKHLYGWERYSQAGITLVDTGTHQTFAVPEFTAKKPESTRGSMPRFPKSRAYIESKPCFRLTRESDQQLQGGQMTIVFECLRRAGHDGLSLVGLAEKCLKEGYTTTTDILHSMLYHLNRIEAVEQL